MIATILFRCRSFRCFPYASYSPAFVQIERESWGWLIYRDLSWILLLKQMSFNFQV